MTQKELADTVGMFKFGDRTIRRWENGESQPSSIKLKHILSFHEKVPFPNNENAPYKIIDLFAGIGGTRLGFYQTGKTNVVFSSEIDKFAVKQIKQILAKLLLEILQKHPKKIFLIMIFL